MGAHLVTRRRLINAKGRPMILRRPHDVAGTPTPVDLPVVGFLWVFTPDKIVGAIIQGDAQIQILNDEISAASWPCNPVGTPTGGRTIPGRGDWIMVDDTTWFIQANNPVYEGADIIGHTLWVRGGEL